MQLLRKKIKPNISFFIIMMVMSWALDGYVFCICFDLFFSINSFICTSDCWIVTASKNETGELKEMKKRRFWPHIMINKEFMLLGKKKKKAFIDLEVSMSNTGTGKDFNSTHSGISQTSSTNDVLWKQFELQNKHLLGMNAGMTNVLQ